MRAPLCLLVFAFILVCPGLAIEQQAQTPNSNPVYQQLRRVSFSGETASASGVTLKRDAGTFTFQSGIFKFLAPVNGKVTGAAFAGEGSFSLTPPNESEKRSLRLLTAEPAMREQFKELVLRFTDSTYDEIKRQAGAGAANPEGGGYFGDIKDALQHKLHYNLDGRILEDVMSDQPGGLFVAFIKGDRYSNKMIYAIDPHGIDNYMEPTLAPEEVALMTWGENKTGIWAAFRLASEIAGGSASSSEQNNVISIKNQKLNTTIEKGGYLRGDASTTFEARTEGLRVVPLNLAGSLRVSSVSDSEGHALDFIQEDKKEDPDLYVVLPKSLHKGDSCTIRTVYAGKDAVIKTGEGNYFPAARENWYPNQTSGELGNYAMYDMTFHAPKGMTMVATGLPVSDSNQGDENITEWTSKVPLTVAGFNLGRFKPQEAALEKNDFKVLAYANQDEPDFVKALKHYAEGSPFEGGVGGIGTSGETGLPALGMMNTTQMMKHAMAEGQLAEQIYIDYFGPSSYPRLAITQQTATNFGQSWPELVYLPITAFFDETVRHQLGMGNADTRGYFRVVGPHEIAHQWWGHTVGFSSYRDQWMSEGFADFSASLVLQNAYGIQKFREFWNDEREFLTQRDKEGFRGIDAGPVTEGYRAGNTKTGWSVPRDLIYPKGAYILHMLRMMMFDQKTGDAKFKEMMRDFVETYRNKAATTQDFKRMVEKHMSAAMDLDHNHTMDWFFDPFVYGTALPNYRAEATFENRADGIAVMNLKLTQSNVNDNFKMLVPVYLELADGRTVRFGTAPILGNHTVQQQVPLGHVPALPKRAIVNYMYDVLSTEN